MAEWSRAHEALRAAETLTREHCYADAISRAYYAILHAAKAAVHIHDVAVASHAAVRQLDSIWFAPGRSNRSGQRTSLRASMIASQPIMMSKPFFLKKTLETSVAEAVSF